MTLDNMWVRQTNQHLLFTGKYRCKNTMCVVGNRGGRGYTLLAEESIMPGHGSTQTWTTIIDLTRKQYVLN